MHNGDMLKSCSQYNYDIKYYINKVNKYQELIYLFISLLRKNLTQFLHITVKYNKEYIGKKEKERIKYVI